MNQKVAVAALVGLNLVLSSMALAKTGVESAKDRFNLIHVQDLAKMQKEQAGKLYIYDANSDDTRKTDGMIPGAKALSSVNQYNVDKELPPKDQAKTAQLVFYCANTKCMASHTAANRAIDAGFTHVSVMADGIQGWKQAGQPTAKP